MHLVEQRRNLLDLIKDDEALAELCHRLSGLRHLSLTRAGAVDYSRMALRLDQKYDKAGRRLFGNDYDAREFDGPLMFSTGAQLFAALA